MNSNEDVLNPMKMKMRDDDEWSSEEDGMNTFVKEQEIYVHLKQIELLSLEQHLKTYVTLSDIYQSTTKKRTWMINKGLTIE